MATAVTGRIGTRSWLGQEPSDRSDERLGMGVVRRVAGPVDHDDATVGEPGVQRSRRRTELRSTVAAKDLENRLPDAAERLEPGGLRRRLRRELAHHRGSRPHA